MKKEQVIGIEPNEHQIPRFQGKYGYDTHLPENPERPKSPNVLPMSWVQLICAEHWTGRKTSLNKAMLFTIATDQSLRERRPRCLPGTLNGQRLRGTFSPVFKRLVEKYLP